jgi:hypothetical protein
MTQNDLFFMHEEDANETVEFSAALEAPARWTDDSPLDPTLQRQISILMDTITRVGGDVCTLRSEMDGLQETNRAMMETFDKLKEVLAAKGTVDVDDFDLACEVMDGNTLPLSGPPMRKLMN